MSYEIKGKIIKLYEKQTFKETFEKREFVIRTEEDYPQEIKFEVTQKMVPLLDGYQEGDEVFLNFNINGKASKDGASYWNNLSVWRIRETKEVPVQPVAKKEAGKKKVTKKEKVVLEEPVFDNPKRDEDMPF